MKVFSCWACAAAVVLGAAVVGTGRADDARTGGTVKLERLTWAQLQKRLANPNVKYTIVDAWSTTCAPCKENFPHVVAMNKKFGPKGLAVISLSLDDPTDKAAVAEAERFLKEKNATFTNILLDENLGDGFDKLNINAIPAVFIFGPDGKEVKRFTMDDPNNQFTYDEVEKAVANLLDAK
jgi:thiol-disulfide isomerase/thioredoxin